MGVSHLWSLQNLQYNLYKWGARDGEYPDSPPFLGYNFVKSLIYRLFALLTSIVCEYSLLNTVCHHKRQLCTIVWNFKYWILSFLDCEWIFHIMTKRFPMFCILGRNMHTTPRYRGYFMCTKWLLRRLGPPFHTSPFKEVSLNRNE